mgnify:FL=1
MIYHLTRPAEGGMLRVLTRLISELNKKGSKQEVWSAECQLGLELETLSVPHKHWPLYDKLALTDLLAYWQQRELGEGLICYHGLKSFLVANPGDNPVFVCFYNALFPLHGKKSLRYLTLKIKKQRQKNLQGVVVASESQAKEAKELFSKVHIIPSGVDTAKFIPSGAREKVIGFLGRLRKEKGIELILAIAKDFTDWTFELAGPDLDGYGTRQLPSNVKLLGAVSQPEKLLSRWSIMLLPSYTEALPLALLEGMSAGLAIVATDTGDIKRVLGEAGLLIPVGDGYRLKEAIGKLIKENSLRAELGQKAREMALTYDWSNIMRLWTELIQSAEVGP